MSILDGIQQNLHRNLIIQEDNMLALSGLPEASVGLVYMDPPFNTGKEQRRKALKSVQTRAGGRIGFGGKSYRDEVVSSAGYKDQFKDFPNFLLPRIALCWRALDQRGSLYLHLDYREVHYARVLLDAMLGPEHFLNEIIWAYDFGGRAKNKWPAKHDSILVYVKNPDDYHFDLDAVNRIPYMAPGLVGKEKAARGKSPTDVWWHTIVGTASKEKTGYPSQKPLGVLRRIVQASAMTDLPILDPFGGSGTTGAAAMEEGHQFILMDQNPEAIAVMRERLQAADPLVVKAGDAI